MKLFLFFKTLFKDYKTNSDLISKKEKRKAYFRAFKILMMYIWNVISAPFIYPIWYIFREKIYNILYKNIKWELIETLTDSGNTEVVEKLLKDKHKFIFWIWTYGDHRDPLGRGGLPLDYKNGKNNFINRFLYSAIRNPRFIVNHLYFRSNPIIEDLIIVNTLNSNIVHSSYGIGDSPEGVLFKWMKDSKNNWYFVYYNSCKKSVFYIGLVGLNQHKRGRFEIRI